MDILRFSIPILAGIIVFIMRTYYKKAWDSIQLPLMIAGSIFSACLVLVMLGAAYVMLQRAIFGIGVRILYCAVIAGLIVLLVLLNISVWKKWKSER